MSPVARVPPVLEVDSNSILFNHRSLQKPNPLPTWAFDGLHFARLCLTHGHIGNRQAALSAALQGAKAAETRIAEEMGPGGFPGFFPPFVLLLFLPSFFSYNIYIHIYLIRIILGPDRFDTDRF